MNLSKLPHTLNSASKRQMMVSFTPVDYDYYNQWARSPRQPDRVDNTAKENSQEPSPESETAAVVPVKPATKQVTETKPLPKEVFKSERSERLSLSRLSSKPQCRSACVSVTESYKLPPLSMKRSTTVTGYERLLKKVAPENTVLPMNRAVFLFKGNVFLQNSDYLPDPSRVSTYNMSEMTLNTRYYPSRPRPGAMSGSTVATVNNRTRSSSSVHIPKVQFIDFEEIRNYVVAKSETMNQPRPKPAKKKHFVPFNFPVKLNSS